MRILFFGGRIVGWSLAAERRRRFRHAVRRRPTRRLQSETLEARCLLAGDVMISEIMYHPASGDVQQEWIELFNAGSDPVALGGARIARGVDFTFPDVTIKPNGYLVVAADVPTFQAQYGTSIDVVGGWTGRLSNSAEQIAIDDRLGGRIDQVTYADSGDWAQRRAGPLDRGQRGWIWNAPHDGGGRSLELINTAFDNAYAHNWQASLNDGGTPGGVNSVAAPDIAPAISAVAHQPIIPSASDQVTVTARFADEDPSGVTGSLFWRVSTLDPGAFHEEPLLDDGLHGDGDAGDGLYGAVIPAQGDQTIVEFYVRAVDGGGRARTSPGPTDALGTQGANMLYQVDDKQERLSNVPRYRSIMTALDWQAFRNLDRHSDAQMNASFVATVGGITEVRYNVGIRYRGSGSRTHNPPNNRINIPSDRPWFGDTRININANNPRNQIAGSALFALAGLPAADGVAVRMMHNGTNLAKGVNYVHLEVLNSDWAGRHFPRDGAGNAYRGRRANEGPPGGLGAGLAFFGEDPGPYASYVKGTNASERDWSDVIRLTDVLNNAPDDTYVEQLEQVVNVDQWLRTIAMVVLTGDMENGLLTGDAGGDDFALYRGTKDARFLMVPYDLDTMFQGPSGSLFRTDPVPALRRLLSNPQIVPRYYAQLTDLMDHVLTEEKVRPILESVLVLESETRINRILTFLQRARDVVRRLIPTELSASSDLAVSGGLPHTGEATSGPLRGTANALTTRSVRVAGREAAWDARRGTWSIADLPLAPGVNRLQVQTFGEDGQEIDHTFVDIWRETGATREVTGTITTDTVWTAEDGPYRVMGDVTVAENATLTIAPGTSVYFDAGARLTIRGRLLAEGTDRSLIRFTRVPGTNTTWGGVQLVNTVAENRIRYAVLEYGVTNDGMVGVVNARAEIDHVTFDHSDRRRIHTANASLVVRNSTFTDMFGPDQPPTSDNLSEQITGSGILEGGEMVIEGNTFGITKGHNDVIDFTGPTRPGPILQVLNNTFAGSGDEALDLGGDAYIEGNLFEHVHQDQYNQGSGDSNVISTGDGGVNSVITAVRNVFRDVDHVINLKRNTFLFFENNTVIGISEDTDTDQFSAINFLIPRRDPPGKGAYLNGNVFRDIPQRIFGHVDEGFRTGSTELEMHNTLVPPERAADVVGQRPGTILDLGTGNIAADPRLIDPSGDVRLRAGSPAIGSGPNGIDRGAAVAAGASISGEPAPRTAETSATLNVAGPGVTHYRYRLNDGPWSQATPVEVPIALTDLDDGTYQVTVIGQNFAGVWQAESAATVSRAWTVDRALALLQINEILADNRSAVEHAGTFPDLVELANRGGAPVDLSGFGLTDDRANPDRFVFPEGTSIAAGERLVLVADRQFGTPGIHLGFSLNSEGEGLYLYDRPADGGGLLDAIEFGIQVPDLSLGRRDDGQWVLSQPTFGAANLPARLGDPAALRINEWLAATDTVLPDEFIEIHNADPLPVDLGGLFLTDHPVSWRDRYPIAPHSYIAGSGFAVFDSDVRAASGSNHVNFRLARQRGMIGLFGTNLKPIDQVRYSQQFPDRSQGMVPDGGLTVTSFPLPSPGLSNTDDTFLPLWEGLRITEIMYHPIGGSDFEFMELQNSGEATLPLAGVRLTRGIDFTFPDIELAPGELIVVVNNRSAFQSRYGTGIRIAGEFGGKLGNGGERIRLQLPDPHPGAIQNFRYSDTWYPRTDGTGFSLVPSDPRGGRTDWSRAAAWRASSFVNGSPGAADSNLDAGAIVINEVLANTDDPAGARIELLNQSDTTLDISGWYLSDDPNDLAKYQIPAGSVLPAGGLIVFGEQADFGTVITVDKHIGQIWIASPDAVGSVAGISAGVSYTAVDAGVTLGRYLRSDGSAVFVEQLAETLGAENAGPAVGPVVIDEVLYDPAEGEDEFIELSNSTDQAVSLNDATNPDNTWRLAGSVEYVFPAGMEIAPGGLLLITGTDPATFRARHAIPDDVPILGPYTGSLGDEGGDVRIVRPGVPDGLFIPAILVDRVQYDNQAPWPAEAAGGGSSLNRLQADQYGDDVANWEASLVGGTPGLPNLPLDRTPASVPTGLSATAASGPAVALAWQTSVDPESGIDGYRIYRNGELLASATTPRYDDFDVQPLTAYTYEVASVNRQGLESAKSQAAEIFLMSIESVTARFADEVLVRFSEPVDALSAAVAENYTIDGIEISSAALAMDGQTLTLATSPLSVGTTYQLTVDALSAVSGHPLAPQSTISFELVPAVPGFTIRGIHAAEEIIDSVPDANRLRKRPAGDPSVDVDRTFIYPTVNFIDDDGHQPLGLFAGDRPFPADQPGDDDDVVVRAAGTIIIPPGEGGAWTFAVNVAPSPDTVASQRSEDGFRVRIDDTRYLFARDRHGPELRLATVTLSEGRHFVDMVAFERTNWSELELVAARGAFATLGATDTWRLVGDTAGGGLAVFTDPLAPEPIAWHRAAPAGSLVFEQTRDYEVSGPETAVVLSTWLPADQPLSLIATPVDTAATLSLLLRGEAGDVVFRETAPGAGQPLTMANFRVPVAGTYRVEWTSDLPVRAKLDATLGASIETEPLASGNSNDTTATAQSIDVSYLDLGQGVVRGAVLGELAGTERAESTADDIVGSQTVSFDFSDLPSLDDGATLVITATADLDGPDEFLTLRGQDRLGRVVLVRDLFVSDGRSDRPVTTSMDFSADQLRALADRGVISLSVTPSDAVGRIPETALALALRFGETRDTYRLSLAASETVGFTLAARDGKPLDLALFDAAGNRLGLGTLGPTDGPTIIRNFAVPVSGTYFLQVGGTPGSPYSLIVTRNSDFDALPNDTLDSAPDISRYGSVLGAIGGARTGGGGPSGATLPVTLPVFLNDADGFQWDIQNDGSIGDGSSDAFDGGLRLLNFPFLATAESEDAGREIVLGPQAIPGVTDLNVTRKIFIPADQSYARFLEVVTNTGSTPQDFTVQIDTNLGSDTDTALIATSVDDGQFTPDDLWVVTDDSNGSGDPAVAHVVAGAGAQAPGAASVVDDNVSFSYTLQLAPGETQIVMHFAVQSNTQAEAIDRAGALADLQRDALAGMSAAERSQLINFSPADIVDSYALQVAAGQSLTLTTATPSIGPGPLGNQLDPTLELIDPRGIVVAHDDNSADGVNAALTYEATLGGTYRVRVASEQGAGEYLLRVTGAERDASRFEVTGSEPVAGAGLNALPRSYRLELSSAVSLDSLDAADLTIDGVAAGEAVAIDGRTVQFTFDQQPDAVEGLHTVSLAAGALTDLAGVPNEPFAATFLLDSTPPHVASTTFNGSPLGPSRVVQPGPFTFTATFDESIDGNALDAADIVLRDKHTSMVYQPFFSYDAASQTLSVFFGQLAEGDYTLTLVSRDDAFADTVGNALDGEPNGTHPDGTVSGDGTQGGDYTIPFRIDADPRNADPQFRRLKPFGSLVDRARIEDTISFEQDVDTFELDLVEGETLQAVAAPSGGASPLALVVRGPESTVIASITAPAPGDPAETSLLPIAATGRYRVEVSGGAIGDRFVLTLLRNAVAEGDDTSDDMPRAIDPSRTELGLARYAVVGRSAPAASADVDTYTLDLTGRPVSSIDILLTGLENADFSQQSLELRNAAGDLLLASGTPHHADPSVRNFDTGILGFPVRGGAVYSVRVASTVDAEYSLVVTEQAAFDAEPNDSESDGLRNLDGLDGALGFVGATATRQLDDPRGDPFATGPIQPDIKGIRGNVSEGMLTLTLDFFDPIPSGVSGPLLAGYFELDLDEDPTTGDPAFQNQFAPADQQGGPLGVEARVFFNSQDTSGASVFDTQFNSLGTVPLRLDTTSLEVSVPLSLFGTEDGSIHVGTLVWGSAGGTSQFALSDAAPNTEFLATAPTDPAELLGDSYAITLHAGQVLEVETETPLTGTAASPRNRLDPNLKLFDPTGTLAFEDSDSAADGKNARFRYTAITSGTFRIEVGTDGQGGGAYTLRTRVSGAAGVRGRFLLYNDSVFDGNDPRANRADDAAIDVDKQALFAGEHAGWVNYSNYVRGINGVVVDLENSGGVPTLADFDFRVGDDGQGVNWRPAPGPSSITVRPGDGVGGSNRVTLIWDDHAIENAWLEVTIRANATTGLDTPDRFYFGNAIGDSGNSTDQAIVDLADELAARGHPHTFLNPATIDNPFDYNRDGKVNATDEIIARNHATTADSQLRLITIPREQPMLPVSAASLASATLPAIPTARPRSTADRRLGGRLRPERVEAVMARIGRDWTALGADRAMASIRRQQGTGGASDRE